MDILHNVHGFICHHIVEWVLNLVDTKYLNLCISFMPCMVGLKAYPNSLSKYEQWTG